MDERIEVRLRKEVEQAQISELALSGLEDVFERLERAMVDSWLNLPTDDAESAQKIKHRQSALRLVRKLFESDIKNGKAAKQKLDKLESK